MRSVKQTIVVKLVRPSCSSSHSGPPHRMHRSKTPFVAHGCVNSISLLSVITSLPSTTAGQSRRGTHQAGFFLAWRCFAHIDTKGKMSCWYFFSMLILHGSPKQRSGCLFIVRQRNRLQHSATCAVHAHANMPLQTSFTSFSSTPLLLSQSTSPLPSFVCIHYYLIMLL